MNLFEVLFVSTNHKTGFTSARKALVEASSLLEAIELVDKHVDPSEKWLACSCNQTEISAFISKDRP